MIFVGKMFIHPLHFEVGAKTPPKLSFWPIFLLMLHVTAKSILPLVSVKTLIESSHGISRELNKILSTKSEPAEKLRKLWLS